MLLCEYGDCMNLHLFATCQSAAHSLETLLGRRRTCKGTAERKERLREDVCGRQGRRKRTQGAGGEERHRRSEGVGLPSAFRKREGRARFRARRGQPVAAEMLTGSRTGGKAIVP